MLSRVLLNTSCSIVLSLVAAFAIAAPRSDFPQSQSLGFQVTLEVDGKLWSGQVVMTHEKWLNGSNLRLTSHFATRPPKALGLPEYENLQEDGGMIFTKVSGQDELVRITEYGTFAHMGEMVGKLESFPEGLLQPLDNRMYLSRFLLLEEPASVKGILSNHDSEGFYYALVMSDNSEILWHLDHSKGLKGIQVKRAGKFLTYRVAPPADEKLVGATF